MKKRIEERGRELFFNKSAEFFTRDYIPVFRDHRFFAHLFIFNNVTHTKMQDIEVPKSYQRMRAIIDYSDMGIVLLSENEKVMFLNDRFLQLFHIRETADSFINRRFHELWNSMCGNARIDGIGCEQIRDVVYFGKQIVNREIVINGSNTLQCLVEPMVYESRMQKKMRETLIRVVDITPQKNVEQALRQAKEEAEAIARARSHILSAMSHEICTPLNGILGFSVMLKESLSDPSQREMAEVIDQSGRRLLETMNAILDFSVAQSEKKPFGISATSVNRMIQEQIDTHRASAMQKGLYLYAEIAGEIGVAIVDHVLHKILYHLINNGIKYTVAGGVKVEARLTVMDGSEWLELKVIDTGVGIDELKHRTIFEPFRQASEGYGRAFEGTGLGLSLVKEYVQKANGKIYLASRKNKGSTFTVLLPDAYDENSDKTYGDDRQE
jgi:signal transduction histidine kinase